MSRSAALRLLALLALSGAGGCCLEISVAVGASTTGAMASGGSGAGGGGSSMGPSGTATAGTSGPGSNTGSSSSGTTGGQSSGGSSSGGTSSGGFDAGICLIDGEPVAAGTWFSTVLGSCTTCDPSLSSTAWTVLASGAHCLSYFPFDYDDSDTDPPYDVPILGLCNAQGGTSCSCIVGGGACSPGDGGSGCCGGYCDSNECIITENLGFFTYCAPQTYPALPNPCAQGPCCLDAGQGHGWCCGLTDGGAKTCVPAGVVCFDTSSCCDGMTCVGTDAVKFFDEAYPGYGLCEPN